MTTETKRLDIEAIEEAYPVACHACGDTVETCDGIYYDHGACDASGKDVPANVERRAPPHVAALVAEVRRLREIIEGRGEDKAAIAERDPFTGALETVVAQADEIARLRAEIARFKTRLAARTLPPDGAPCSKCHGTGVARIAPQRQRVLDAVRALGTASPADVLDALEGVDTETAINRAAGVCAWLAAHGLLESLGREGRRVMYRASTRAVEDDLRESAP